MIAAYSDIHDRSLFQLGNWHILRTGFEDGDGFKTCYAAHTNCAPIKWNVSIRIKDNICFRCGVAVPDEIQALIAMLYWDNP